MFIGWLTCIQRSLLPHSLCRFTTANAPANRQMPIASVVRHNSKNEKIDQLSMLTTENLIIENQRLMWSLVRSIIKNN